MDDIQKDTLINHTKTFYRDLCIFAKSSFNEIDLKTASPTELNEFIASHVPQELRLSVRNLIEYLNYINEE